jgi:hypothetical protein
MGLLSRIFCCLLSFAVMLTFNFLKFLDFLCHCVLVSKLDHHQDFTKDEKKKQLTSPAKICRTAALLNASGSEDSSRGAYQQA